VLPHDPAIDPDKSDLEKYTDNFGDMQYLKLIPDIEPTQFRIGPLPEGQIRGADGYGIESVEWNEFVIRCGCLELKNLPIEQPDGSIKQAPQPDRDDKSDSPMSSQKWLDACMLSPMDKELLASMIWGVSIPRPLSSMPSARRDGASESLSQEG
jgi:hypothetical protein